MEKSNFKIPEIVLTCDEDENEANETQTNLLKQVDSYIDVLNKDSFESNCLGLPNMRPIPRQSVVSRHSIEMFLSNFPENGSEFANREILSTVHDIFSSSIGLNEKMSCAEKVRTIIQSHKFHLFLIGLVILDCICVIIQIIIDIIAKDVHNHKLHFIEEFAEILSVLILSLFLLSILVHILFIPKIFFKSKLEIFDALIVIISFCLEIISIYKKDSVKAIEAAAITFRFWRIIRIVNAIVIAVEKRVYQKLDNLKNDIKIVLDENKSMETDLELKCKEIIQLKSISEEKNKQLKEMQTKFQNFITENSKLRLKERVYSDELRLNIKKLDSKVIELENKSKQLALENEELKSKVKIS